MKTIPILNIREIIALNYCEPHLEQMWAARIAGILLGCDFRDTKQKLAEVRDGLKESLEQQLARKSVHQKLTTKFQDEFDLNWNRLQQDEDSDRQQSVIATGEIEGHKFQVQLVFTMNTPNFLSEDGTEIKI